MLCRHAVRALSMIAAIMFLALPLGAFAQQATGTTGPTEIPARLRHLEGTVTVQRAAAGETDEAVMNLPLGSGDRLWSSESGRVEIMFEDGTSIWMDASTTLDFVSLPRPDDRSGAIVRLWTGSVFVGRPPPQSDTLVPLRLDSPAGAVTLDQAGLFRIDFDEENRVWLSAYDGSAALDAGGLSEVVAAGQRTLAELGSAPAEAVAFNTSEADEFGDWREQRMALLASTQKYVGGRDYVPSNIAYYAADLEAYGDWSYHPAYDAWYWRPDAAVAWSPYRDGRWVYGYQGWSWVPSTSWGYVTTHYGRWQYGNGGWMWFPGSVWAPANVQWYVDSSYVGWAPLNYYDSPAVSFGTYLGGGTGVGVSVGGGYGGYDGYPYYGYGYPYGGGYGGYGYGGYGFGLSYGYGGFYYGYGGYGYGYDYGYWGWGHGGGYRPAHLPAYGGHAYPGGPIGSASGTGRVVRGRGYSSGLANAWTVVPSKDLSARNVGRVAVARADLPRDLAQGPKAQITGPLRARQPSRLVPSSGRTARPTIRAGRGAVPSSTATNSVRATSTRVAASSPSRRATLRTGTPAPRSAAPSATGGPRRALGRRDTSTARSYPSRSATPTRYDSGRSLYPTTGATRRALTSPQSGRTATVRGSTPSSRYGAPSRSAPSVRYGTPSRSAPSTRYGTPSRSARSTGYGTPSRSARSPRGSGSIRATRSSRYATPSRSRLAPRRSGSMRAAPAVRSSRSARPGGGMRSASRPRGSGGAVRAGARPGGSGARPGGRAAKPRGGHSE